MAPQAGSPSTPARRNPAYVPRSEDKDPLGALERYASTPNPETLPAKVIHAHTDKTVTVYDAFPKSIYHLLILPRPREGVVTVPELLNLRTLLKGDKARAKRILEELGEAAESARRDIEEEMRSAYKCKWDIWTGFHALPSMRHIHLHVMSADLCTDAMKKKKHYNTFHPGLGFFLHYKDVMDWFDATPSYYDMMREFRISMYKPFMDAPLQCFKCDEEFKNMPALKKHLQEEFDTMKTREKERMAREKERLEKKRKREEARAAKAAAASLSQASNASSSTTATVSEGSPTTHTTSGTHDDAGPSRSLSPPVKRQATGKGP